MHKQLESTIEIEACSIYESCGWWECECFREGQWSIVIRRDGGFADIFLRACNRHASQMVAVYIERYGR